MRNEKNLGPKTSNPMPKPDKPFRACPALALDCCCCFIELRRNHSLGPASKKLLPQSLLQATAPPPPPRCGSTWKTGGLLSPQQRLSTHCEEDSEKNSQALEFGMAHTPHSPDLAPTNCLFGSLSKDLHVRKIDDIKHLIKYIIKFFYLENPGIQKLPGKWQYAIDNACARIC